MLSGIKRHAQFETLRRALQAFPDEIVAREDHEAAAQAGNTCRSMGVAVSAVDMLICAIARSRGMSIFTTDPDFNRYAEVLDLNLHAPASRLR
ncbi:MAG TPA: PIN domain-containing protein [Bryobacteraceae bacterium]